MIDLLALISLTIEFIQTPLGSAVTGMVTGIVLGLGVFAMISLYQASHP